MFDKAKHSRGPNPTQFSARSTTCSDNNSDERAPPKTADLDSGAEICIWAATYKFSGIGYSLAFMKKPGRFAKSSRGGEKMSPILVLPKRSDV